MVDHDDAAAAAAKPKKRIVIVGCGQIVTHHVEQMAKAGDESFQVMALCDPNPKRRQIILESCQQHGLPTFLSLPSSSSSSSSTYEFDTLTDFLQHQQEHQQSKRSIIPTTSTSAESGDTAKHSRDNRDEKFIFLIAVPHYLHESIALEALASGNHVVLEKPLAPTLQSCQILRDASLRHETNNNNNKNMLIVAEQSPFWEEIVLAKTMIQNGEIGTIVSAASYFYESMRDNLTSGVDELHGGLGWRCSLEKAGGGLVIDGGLHWIRPLREVCGDVERVVGVTRSHVAPELQMEGETLAHAIFQIKSPCTASTSALDFLNQPPNAGPLFATFSSNMMHSAPMAYDSCPYFRFTGTLGELVVSGTGLNPNGGGGLRLYNEDNVYGKDLFPAGRQRGFYLGFRGLWKEISRILDEDDWEAAEKTVENAAKDVAVALAIYESARSGKWVTL